jgi:uncharacterized RDD family membrane protein YckC
MSNPYAPPRSERPVPKPSRPAGARPLASLGKRFGAALLDGLFTFVVGTAVSIGIAAMTGMERTTVSAQLCFLVPLAVQWALVANRGQSVGKMLLGTRITMTDGRQPGFFNGVVLRAWPVVLVGFLPALTGPTMKPFTSLVMLADLAVIFAAGHRCLHDRFAGTEVVDAS